MNNTASQKALETFFKVLATCEKNDPKIQKAWKGLNDIHAAFIFTAKANGFGSIKTLADFQKAFAAWNKNKPVEIIEDYKI